MPVALLYHLTSLCSLTLREDQPQISIAHSLTSPFLQSVSVFWRWNQALSLSLRPVSGPESCVWLLMGKPSRFSIKSHFPWIAPTLLPM